MPEKYQGHSQPGPDMPMRPLERISTEADRLSRLACGVQDFLDRFYGNPLPPATAADGAAVPSRSATATRSIACPRTSMCWTI